MDSCLICDSPSIENLEERGTRVQFECPVCYDVIISSSVMGRISNMPDDRWLLSAYFRKLRDNPTPDDKIITTGNLSQIVDEMKSLKPTTIIEAQNRVLEYFGNKSDLMGSWVKYDFHSYRDAVIEKQTIEYVIESFLERGFLEVKRAHAGGNYFLKGDFRLTMDGWKAFEEIYRQRFHSKQAFIAMNFDESCLDIWKKAIIPAFDDTEFKPYRIDEDRHLDNINNKIIAEIRKSRFVVAEFTGHKHGVYFEAGFAMGLGIPVIWICKESDFDKTHFDTKHFNHIVWKDYEELKKELHWFIRANIIIT